MDKLLRNKYKIVLGPGEEETQVLMLIENGRAVETWFVDETRNTKEDLKDFRLSLKKRGYDI